MTDRVALIDYGSGNLRSAAKALERAVADQGLDARIAITSDPGEVRRADRIVLPGVGAFADCKAGLDAIPGMVDALTERVIEQAAPFLGICVGMQLMARISVEYGTHPGLGWLDASVEALIAPDPSVKIPHMGWNELIIQAPDHPVLAGLTPGTHAYFVHSYAMKVADPALVLAACDYAGGFPAMVGRDNLVGTQFHPEKSQAAGLAIIGNFLGWRP